MSDSQQKKMSRRAALKRTAMLAAGAVIVPQLLAGKEALAAPAAKSSWRTSGEKAAVQYRPRPNGNQDCSKCSHFTSGQAAGSNGYCQVVEATITPHGWCTCFSAGS